MPRPTIRIRPLRRNDWSRVEALFGARGACGGCWCMYWRRPRGGVLWQRSKGAINQRAFRALVGSGKVNGLLACAGRETIGWCSLGPRSDFPKIENSPSLRLPAPPRTWVVSCFFVRREWRGQGIAAALLDAAVAMARRKKAATLDGYPVLTSGAKTLPHAWAWTGVPVMFENAGFSRVARTDHSRPVYRRAFARR